MISTDAWLLHKITTGSNRFRAVFFTANYGVLHAYHRASRRNQGFLQAFSPLWLICEERRQWYYVRTVECLGAGLSLSQKALFAGLYINEILFHILQPGEAIPSLYLAYTTSIKGLETAVNTRAIEVILRSFEMIFLQVLGYALPLTLDLDRDARYLFIPGDGVVRHDRGVLGAHLLGVFAQDFQSDEVLKAAKQLMRCAIDHLLDGKIIQTRKLYACASSS